MSRTDVTDGEGVRWRVLDVRFGPPHNPPHRWTWHAPPDPCASSRCFACDRRGIGGRRETKSYHWREGESRADVSEATLLRQLRAAEWWDRRPVRELVPGYTPESAPQE